MDLERVLRTGLKIIWGKNYTTFEDVFKEGKLRTLEKICGKNFKKFVRKSIKNKKFCKWFSENTASQVNTRAPNRTKYKPVHAKKAFYKKSPIPTLTSIANTLV